MFVSKVTSRTTKSVPFLYMARTFLYFADTVSRLVLRPRRASYRYKGFISGDKFAGEKFTAHLHLVPKSRMRGCSPPRHYAPSGRADKVNGNVYIYTVCYA